MSLSRTLERKRVLRLSKQAKRAAKKVRFPKDFQGAVMWCPLCYRELGRFEEGKTCSPEDQQTLVDSHRAVCRRAQMKVCK